MTAPSGAHSSRSSDHRGLPGEITQPLGSQARNYFDAEGRLIRQVALDGNVAELSYDPAGRLVQVVDGAGHEATIERTPGGRLLAVTRADGRRDTFRYDERGLLVGARWADTVDESWERDSFGRILTHSRAGMLLEQLTYNAVGEVVEGTGREGTFTAQRDQKGQAVSLRTERGAREFAYDARGALTAMSDERGQRTALRYDVCGRRAEAVGPLGGSWRYEFDAVGRPAARIDPLGRRQQLERDVDGNVIARIEADGSGTQWRYRAGVAVDAVGAAGGGWSDEFDLDPLGRLTGARGSSGQVDIAYTIHGDVETVRTPDGALHWDHDEEGNITGLGVDGGAAVRFAFDSDGIVTGYRDAGGDREVPVPSAPPAWAVERDEIGQLIRAERPGASDSDRRLVLTWTWDAGGRLLSESGTRGTRSYTYDDAGQLTGTVDDGGRTTYRYDDAGRRVEQVGEDGAAVRYLRRVGLHLPATYPDVACDFLVNYTDGVRLSGSWVFNHILFHETKKYGRANFRFGWRDKDNEPTNLKHRAYGDTWKRLAPPAVLAPRAREVRRGARLRHRRAQDRLPPNPARH